MARRTRVEGPKRSQATSAQSRLARPPLLTSWEELDFDHDPLASIHCAGSGAISARLVRESEGHGRPVTNFAFDNSGATVKIHDGFHESQAQA
jgi:hypothetical protein